MMTSSKISKFFLYLVPFSVIWVYQQTLFPFIVGKYVFFRTVVELAAIFFVWAWALGDLKISNLKSKILNPITISVSVFTLIYLFAGLFGYNPAASFWSNFERGEGSFQMLHLWAFFMMAVFLFNDTKDWKRLFDLSLWAGALMIGYGILGAMGLFNFVGSSLCQRFAGSLGNAAYVGTYLIFGLFYAGYRLIEEWKTNKKWLYSFFILLFFIFMVLSQTRGALIGLAVGIMAGLAYLGFKLQSQKQKLMAFGAIAAILILGSLGVVFRRDIDVLPFCGASGGNRILDISFGTENYQTRLALWKQSVKIWEERPILGWGPENFYPAIEKYHLPELTAWFDRAHSVYFDYLTMTGILGLLAYLGMFISYFVMLFRRQSANNNLGLTIGHLQFALLLSVFVAYLVQGAVLFDVLSIYINVFALLAFGCFVFYHKKPEHNLIKDK